jgi:cytidine deaminase
MEKLQLVTCFIQYQTISELPENEQELIVRAQKASARSYSPYSHFQVGAALRLDNGLIIEGNNQENAAYPSGLCAERVALFYANSQYPDNKVEAIAISVFAKGQYLENPIPPCGGCRQVILETEKRYGQPIKILLAGTKQIVEVQSATDLLPLHFDNGLLIR